ncbi:hypothetical protein ACQPXM_39180 [Kribbella sp. CA-253562]|uniref:hypothetical protein n=1 Tax=Kribbella sp. CA-253562 TaxID=3239942 RepID=UPI003D94EECF
MSADCVLLPGHRHQLAAELVERPGSAPPVDAYEVAAALEASGISDRTASERYGRPDVFALGAELLPSLRMQAVGHTHAVRAARVAVIPTLQRGLVFVLPALLTGSAMGGRTAQLEVVLLLAAVAYGWAASQGVAYAGYALTSAGSLPEARRLMRDLAVVALVPALVGAGLVWWQLPAAGYVLAVAVSQIAYVLASTVGVVLRRPGVMLAALLPGLLVAVPDMLSAWPPRPVVLGGIGVSVVATVTAALVMCRGGRRPGRAVRRTVLSDSRLYAAYGACLALLLTLGLVDGLVAPTPGLSLTLLPLVGGVVVAEWQLERYRSQAGLVLQTTTSAAAFGQLIRRALLRCSAGYLLVLVGLTALLTLSSDLTTVIALRFGATVLLGWAFLAALLLVAHRQVVPVVLVTGAGVVLAACRYFVMDQPFVLAVGYLAICGSLATTLSVLAWQRLTRVEVHR